MIEKPIDEDLDEMLRCYYIDLDYLEERKQFLLEKMKESKEKGFISTVATYVQPKKTILDHTRAGLFMSVKEIEPVYKQGYDWAAMANKLRIYEDEEEGLFKQKKASFTRVKKHATN